MIDLDVVIAGAEDVPALPKSASRLAELFSQEEWEIDDVTETVKLDPVLTGRLFRAANSATSGSACAIGDIDQAVMRVGPGATLALAMSAAARTELDVVLPAYGLPAGQLWRSSVAAALTIERIRKFSRKRLPPEAFAAALLHDIGILILSHQMETDVIDLLRSSREEGGRDLVESEAEILGVHHGEVGGLIARHWDLPEVMAEAITFHHDPQSAPTEAGRDLADFVALADSVAVAVACGDGSDLEYEGVSYDLLERVGLDAESYAELVRDVEEGLDQVLTRYD